MNHSLITKSVDLCLDSAELHKCECFSISFIMNLKQSYDKSSTNSSFRGKFVPIEKDYKLYPIKPVYRS